MDITHLPSEEHVVVRQVGLDQPLKWLQLGWRDFRRAPADTVFYGAVFVLMGYMLNIYYDYAPQFVITFATLFLLAGPFLAIGLYDISRQLEAFNGGRVSLLHSMTAWRVNIPGFTLFAALLTVLVFGWFRMSLLIFALFYDGNIPSLDTLLLSMLGSEHMTFAIAYFTLGFFFALAVFAVSVVAIPMLLHKDVDTITAMVTSVRAVFANIVTMMAWAAMIVILTAIGFATYFVGLLIIMPVLGLASWHAYRALVEYET